MKTLIYSTRSYEKAALDNANTAKHDLTYVAVPLSIQTAPLADGFTTIIIFVNDDASAKVLEILHEKGVRNMLLRCAGYNNVDLAKAKQLGIRVARVPEYSPYAVAEHAVAMMLTLNRKLIRANNRVHELNFSLDGLMGFDMHGKTVGVIGTGKIGQVLVRILHGFGCRILAFDKFVNETLAATYGVEYTSLDNLYEQSDIISLHVPLMESTHYMINAASIAKMKDGVMLINTSRGKLLNTRDVIEGLKKGKIGYVGLDVYEEESNLFFDDHSEDILQDDVISRLLTFKNVLITSHQGFLTDVALRNIADTTMFNLQCFLEGTACENEV
jgi:D-lactate dehydrogenase